MDKTWKLHTLELFVGLSDDRMREIERSFRLDEFGKREIILEPEACCNVYIVESGKVEIYHLTEDGRKIIIDILTPGSIFSDFGGTFASGFFVETIEKSKIYSTEKNAFFKNISQEPVVAERLMRHLFNRLQKMEGKASSLAADSVIKKFIKLLLSLGKETKDGMCMTDSYTHEQLAQMIGVSRQTLTTVINQLERQKIINRDKKRFVFNPSSLQMLAE